MFTCKVRNLFQAAALTMALASNFAYAGTWSSGDLFTSFDESGRAITHYDAQGTYLDTITLDYRYGQDVKGMAFGKEGWLYAVSSTASGFGVNALDSSGKVKATYSGSSYVTGNLSYGKIAFGNGGNFFVAGGDSLVAFTPGSTTGKTIYTANQVYDVKTTNSGNLLVLSAYGLDEIRPDGTLIRAVPLGTSLTDARGLEYDPVTNDVYISMLGSTGSSFQLMRFDGSTGALEASTKFWYGDDLLLTQSGQLIAGSRTQAPGIFDADLNLLGSIGSKNQMFVAQYVSAVPEPASAALLLVGLVVVGVSRRRAKA